MFEEMHNGAVGLMLELSREHIADPESMKKRLAGADVRALFELCAEHELEGVAAAHIMENELMPLPGYWMEAYLAEKKRLSFLKRKSAEICADMYAHGITMAVLKNGGIMTDMVTDEAACPMEDIDSLVRKSDFLAAHELLLENGLEFRFRSEYEKENIASAFADGSTEYCLDMPDGHKMWFELAWRAVAGRWIRQDLEPDTDELIANCYLSGDTKVGILSPEDNLLQVCVHTAKHSYVRAPGLRLHLDVERIVAHKKIDWAVFVGKAEAVHVKTAVYFSLYFAKELFNTAVPDWVLERLSPKRAKRERILRMLSKAGLLHPGKKKFSKLGFLFFQTGLYDSPADMWFVLYPKNDRLHEMYGYTSPLLTPYYLLLHALDLVGIRKAKK